MIKINKSISFKTIQKISFNLGLKIKNYKLK